MPEGGQTLSRARSVDCGDQCLHDLRVELGARAQTQLFDGLVAIHCLAVRAVGRHRAEGIAGAHDPGDERNLLAREPVWVARSVPAFVARANEVANFPKQAAHLVKHSLAFNRVCVDDGSLLIRQGAWLVDDLLRDLDLAHVVAGNEPFYIHSSSDRYALVLPKGSSATSPPMCIGLPSTKMRFVATGPVGSKVKVQIIYRGLLSSVLGILDGGTVSTNGTCQPSPSIGMLGGLLPLLTRSVQFRLVATSGTPKVDDVYLDPMKSG